MPGSDNAFLSLLNNTATVFRQRRTSDGRGGWAIDYVQVDSVLCRIRPTSGTEREVGLQQQRWITHILYIVDGADIKRGDRVEVNGLTVDVLGIREPSLADEHLEIYCNEVQLESQLEEGS